jgi:hypothetical protein
MKVFLVILIAVATLEAPERPRLVLLHPRHVNAYPSGVDGKEWAMVTIGVRIRAHEENRRVLLEIVGPAYSSLTSRPTDNRLSEEVSISARIPTGRYRIRAELVTTGTSIYESGIMEVR